MATISAPQTKREKNNLQQYCRGLLVFPRRIRQVNVAVPAPHPAARKSLIHFLLLRRFFSKQTKQGAHERVCLVKFNFDGGTDKAFFLGAFALKVSVEPRRGDNKKEEVVCHLRLAFILCLV